MKMVLDSLALPLVALCCVLALWVVVAQGEEALHARTMQYFGCQETKVAVENPFRDWGAYAKCLDPDHRAGELERQTHSIIDVAMYAFRWAVVALFGGVALLLIGLQERKTERGKREIGDIHDANCPQSTP